RIMRARFEEKLDCTVTAADGLAGALVPQLILQPLVENSLRYSADRESGCISVTVRVRREGEQLLLEIRDCGPGYGGPGSNGIGLKNLEDRLARLYGAQGAIAVQHRNGEGTSVLVKLPFHTDPMLRGS